jgi:hypothetical protein
VFTPKSHKTQLIKFVSNDPVVPLPVPIRRVVPEWYKKTPRYINGDKKPRVVVVPNKDGTGTSFEGNRSVKACVPYFEAFTNGYAALLWHDLEIIRTPNGPEFRWIIGPTPMDARSSVGLEMLPVPAGHLSTQYVWNNPFAIQTPPGYSVLITHPLNRYDLPFVTLSGIHDSDALLPNGHLPFYLREDFEGVIPRGTPIFHIFPYKRDNWISEDGGEPMRFDSHRRGWEGMTKLIGDYKDRIWQKKQFD